MEKITQKLFKELLAENKNILYKRINTQEENKNDLINKFALLNEEIAEDSKYRTCKHKQSNALMFSDNSWLHFDNQTISKEYYKHNNFIMVIETYGDNYGNQNCIIALIYNIK